jgi:hypothetical protein
MLLPTKHTTLAESLIGLAGTLATHLHKPITIDALWEEFQKINKTKEFPAYHSFDNVVLAIDLLFLFGMVELTSDGKISCV